MDDMNNKILKIITNAKRGMMVTIDSDHMRARPMHVVQDEYEGTLWFFTNLNSEKTEESVVNDVCVTFHDHSGGSYLSVTGSCSVTQDREAIDKYWNSAVDAWFPEGKDSTSVALLRIDVSFGELWENEKTSIGTAFEIAKSKLQNKKPDLGHNQKFTQQ